MNQYTSLLFEKLEEFNIDYTKYNHDALFTMDNYSTIEKEYGVIIPKNLFLTNRQQTKFYLLLIRGDKKFQTKELSSQINSARLSFAKEEMLEEDLHCFKGSTSPFGLLFDNPNKIQLLIDEDLLNNSYLGFHPLDNTMTVKISTDDFLNKFLININHDFIKVKLSGN
jgi:Ala-tRNA(Pro) deacylase